jgi:hypothetical protein
MSEAMEEGIDQDELLTAREAAKLLKLESTWTIYALRRETKLIGYSIGGKNSLRFKKSDVLALVQPTEYVKGECEGRRPQPAEV